MRKFKVGDTIIVSRQKGEYIRYKNRIGTMLSFNGQHYKCKFGPRDDDWDYFFLEEIELAKNKIVKDIINDLL